MHIRTPLDLGLVIRQQRRHLGLNQTDLASRVGVGRQWIVAIEHGKARAELGLVLRTLAALDLTLAVDGGKDTTKQESSIPSPIDLDAVVTSATYHVAPNSTGGWDIRRGGDRQAIGRFTSKVDALDRARKITSVGDTKIYIHDREGRITNKDDNVTSNTIRKTRRP